MRTIRKKRRGVNNEKGRTVCNGHLQGLRIKAKRSFERAEKRICLYFLQTEPCEKIAMLGKQEISWFPLDSQLAAIPQIQGEIEMNPLKAALEAATKTAEARSRVENQFAKELKEKVLFIGEDKDFNDYLVSKGVQCFEHEVNGSDGQMVLYHAKDKNGEVLVAFLFEWESSHKNGVIAIEIKGRGLDIPTEELNKIVADIERDDEPEEKECYCPACQLRRLLH